MNGSFIFNGLVLLICVVTAIPYVDLSRKKNINHPLFLTLNVMWYMMDNMIYLLKEDATWMPNQHDLSFRLKQVWAVTKKKYEEIGFNGAVTHIKQDLQNKGIPLDVIDDYFKNINGPQARNTYEYLVYVDIAC